MTNIPTRSLHVRRRVVTALLAAAVAVLAVPAVALAATKTVRYDGVRLTVPASWPVFHLGADSTVCVRFNRHAVYVGTPGASQDCPLHAVGRTEAILVSPQIPGDGVSAAARGGLAPASVLGAAPSGGSMLRVVKGSSHLLVTATWNHHPAAIRAALGLHSLRAAMLATNGHRPSAARDASRRPKDLPRETSSTTPATPGEVYTGPGFDTCTTQTTNTMAAWGSASPYAAVGIYIGGANAACPWGNLSAAWVSAESAAGWHMIPTYVGLQAPSGSSSCASCAEMSATATQATSQGTAAALDAVAQAQALGIGTGNPIYVDMEGYNTETAGATTAVLAFLEAWTEQLHTSGYASGVYSSGASGIAALVGAEGTGYVEPDELWVADWNDEATATDAYVPSTDWADNDLLHQYEGGHTETYDGVSVDIDSDYLDAATAAAGSGPLEFNEIAAAPSIKITPLSNGSVDVTAAWAGEPGISEFQILAGDSETALTPVETIAAGTTTPVVVNDAYSYFEVEGLSASGTVLGTSAPVAAPSSVAIFGKQAFVSARGSFGIPVSCPNISPCKLSGAVYDGKKLISHVTSRSISRHGGLLMFPLTARAHSTIAADRQVPVTVKLVSSTGKKVTRALDLQSYSESGKAPVRDAKASSVTQTIGKVDFVSNGWVGGILVACTSALPCKDTMRVTRAGALIATARTQTLGSGEVGYLIFRLNTKGHTLMKESTGNRLGVRVSVTTASSTVANGGAAVSGTQPTRAPVAMTLLTLDSYR